MRPAAAAVTIPAVEVVLSIERSGDTICGRVAIDGGPARSFFGWLELIGRLQRETPTAGETENEDRDEPEPSSDRG